MGCLQSSSSNEKKEETEKEPEYSWDKRKQLNLDDYTIGNKGNETCGRLPGTVAGQQLIIKDCNDTKIFVFDHSATVTIDDCVNCDIFLGPVSGSVFFRDCTDCRCIVACQQFRTRDCKKMDFYLCCATQPIIEASTAMRFGCFQCYYPQLPEHFSNANLSVFNNNWSKIHDFTPIPGEKNWSMLPIDSEPERPLDNSGFDLDGLTYNKSSSLVPLTHGERRKQYSMFIFVLLCGEAKDRAPEVIKNLGSLHACLLVHTKELPMTSSDVQRIFKVDVTPDVLNRGDVLSMEYNCEDNVQQLKTIVENEITDPLLYKIVTGSDETMDTFYNFTDMKMS